MIGTYFTLPDLGPIKKLGQLIFKIKIHQQKQLDITKIQNDKKYP